MTYAVEIVVPEGGLGRRLEDMHDFHHQRASDRIVFLCKFMATFLFVAHLFT